MLAHNFLGLGELGLGHKDEDFCAFGIHAKLQAGEIIGARQSGLIGLDLKGHTLLLKFGEQAGGFLGVIGAELMEQGFFVGHGTNRVEG